MKNRILIVILFFLAYNLNAQVTDVVVGVTRPNSLQIDGNTLYFTSDIKVAKINILDDNPMPVIVRDGTSRHSGLALNNNDLYITEFWNGRILKVDISDDSYNIVEVVSGLNNPNRLLLVDNELYFSDSNEDTISKINIDISNPIPEVVLSSPTLDGPIGMVLYGNDLIYSNANSGIISKFNITDDDPNPIEIITGLDTPIGLAINNNKLYIAETVLGKILRIDLLDDTPTAVDVVTGLNGPADLLFANETLYFSQALGNKISKIENFLSVSDFSLNNQVILYPNPANEHIHFKNIKEHHEFRIYNELGQNLMQGKLDSNFKINIENLPSGLYLIVFNNYISERFIKN